MGSSGSLSDVMSCISVWPRETTRNVTFESMPSTWGTVGGFMRPSHEPSRVFILSKASCASDLGAGVLGASILCTSDSANTTVERDIKTERESKTGDSIKRTDFIFILLTSFLLWER